MMNLLRVLKSLSPDECRTVGEDIIALFAKPRDAAWEALFEREAAKWDDAPNATDLALIEAIEKGRARVGALNERFHADGLDHGTLVAAELARRGDPRTAQEYLAGAD